MITFHWFLPTSGDSRDIIGGGHGATQGVVAHRREPTVAYLGQIASAAEQLGFVGALTPTGVLCEDAWLSTAMLCAATERLKFLVAFRPGYYSPTLAAQMGATFQRLSGGRLLVNVVTGGEQAEQRAYGDFLEKDARYARTGEFLEIVRDLWAGKRVDFEGVHLAVEGASLATPPDPIPLVYFGGSSAAALTVAARHADVYLTWGEPLQQVAEKIGRRAGPRPGVRAKYPLRDPAARHHARPVGGRMGRGPTSHREPRHRAHRARADRIGQK